MDRERVLGIIDAAYDARRRGDAEAVSRIWAEGATFEVAGQKELLAAFPAAGPMRAQLAVEELIALIGMHSLTRLQAVVEGTKAAVLWRATVSFADREPFETLLYDLWELDEAGKVHSLVQFADTASIAAEMRALV
jgi:ketosteroid isomerase-like protein